MLYIYIYLSEGIARTGYLIPGRDGIPGLDVARNSSVAAVVVVALRRGAAAGPPRGRRGGCRGAAAGPPSAVRPPSVRRPWTNPQACGYETSLSDLRHVVMKRHYQI